MSIKIKSYVREISIIVVSIAIALVGDDLMQQYEREKISTELRVNLLEEVNEIEKYIITNDYHRYKNKYKNFISIEKVKNITINL